MYALKNSNLQKKLFSIFNVKKQRIRLLITLTKEEDLKSISEAFLSDEFILHSRKVKDVASKV